MWFLLFLFAHKHTQSHVCQDYKEFIDAEGLMPLNSSDLHTTICMEMRMLKHMNQHMLHVGNHTNVSSSINNSSFVTPPEQFGPNKFTFPSIDTPGRQTTPLAASPNLSYSATHHHQPNMISSNNLHLNSSHNADLASVDSSDTFASCQTHPFLSQGDLTADDTNFGTLDMLDSSNLYINPLEKNGSGTLVRGSSLYAGGVGAEVGNQVKKSASGDTALLSLGDPSMDDVGFKTFGGADRGSRVSLNESPVPKHRKTRFQQQQTTGGSFFKPKTRFESAKDSQDSLDGGGSGAKKNRRASFMPTKSIASATKLINQHLFGIQNSNSKGNSFSMRNSLERLCVGLLFPINQSPPVAN